MEITVNRTTYTANSTIGDLLIDGAKVCNTLEDVVRPDGVKVFGMTAIPAGKYRVVITYSPHFNKDLPLLCDVPNFSGVRIHPGNKPTDTEGCILVGVNPVVDYIGKSRDTFEILFPKIQHAIDSGEEVTLEVVNNN